MIHTKKTENGILGYGTVENEKDVEDIIDQLTSILFDDIDDDEEEELEDEPEMEEEDEGEEDYDGLPHVVSVGYADDQDEVVVMNDYCNKWGLCGALLEALAKEWPGKELLDVEMVDKFRELAGVCRERVEINS